MRTPSFHLHQPKPMESVLVCPFSYNSHSVFLLSPSTDTILAHAIIIFFHKFIKSLLLVTGYFSYPPPQSALLFFKLYCAYTSPGDLVKDRFWLEDLGWGLTVSISDMLQVITMFLVHRQHFELAEVRVMLLKHS